MKKLLIAFACSCVAASWLCFPASPPGRAGRSGSQSERGNRLPSRMFKQIKLDECALYRLPPLDPQTLQGGGVKGRLLQTGVVRSLPLNLAANARRFDLKQKGHAAILGIVSAGARQVRVQFTDVRLDAGAQLFVRSMKNQDEFYGPFEGGGSSPDGSFWTPPVEGEGVVVEYFNPRPMRRGETSTLPFQIAAINHVFRD